MILHVGEEEEKAKNLKIAPQGHRMHFVRTNDFVATSAPTLGVVVGAALPKLSQLPRVTLTNILKRATVALTNI
jgi:hypothetical protein